MTVLHTSKTEWMGTTFSNETLANLHDYDKTTIVSFHMGEIGLVLQNIWMTGVHLCCERTLGRLCDVKSIINLSLKTVG